MVQAQIHHNSAPQKPKQALTSSMALAQVGEAPDVTQTHTESHAGQHVLGFVVPLGSVSSLLHLQPFQLIMAQDPILQAWVRQLQLHDLLCSLRCVSVGESLMVSTAGSCGRLELSEWMQWVYVVNFGIVPPGQWVTECLEDGENVLSAECEKKRLCAWQ